MLLEIRMVRAICRFCDKLRMFIVTKFHINVFPLFNAYQCSQSKSLGRIYLPFLTQKNVLIAKSWNLPIARGKILPFLDNKECYMCVIYFVLAFDFSRSVLNVLRKLHVTLRKYNPHVFSFPSPVYLGHLEPTWKSWKW